MNDVPMAFEIAAEVMMARATGTSRDDIETHMITRSQDPDPNIVDAVLQVISDARVLIAWDGDELTDDDDDSDNDTTTTESDV